VKELGTVDGLFAAETTPTKIDVKKTAVTQRGTMPIQTHRITILHYFLEQQRIRVGLIHYETYAAGFAGELAESANQNEYNITLP
jgi:hypothetical protein